ncbi:MAG TPA: DUF1254 domain-containing protein [Thermoleophilaceae bacterium]|nr:DUF1254 domain-containing protein [Thermoleophilaceae bacterium]
MRRALLAALVVSATVPGVASAAPPAVPNCALGRSGADLRGFEARALAKAERRFRSPAAKRAYSTGVAAYVYGLAPLSVSNTVPRFPRNQIVSIATLVEPEVRTVIAPNVDTTYTVGQIDLSDGPLVVDVPDTGGRYYVLQFMDAYSNTFAYVGRRTTGTSAGSHVLVPPGYSGALPAGARRINSPTNLIWLIGRTLVRSTADLPAVEELMRAYRLTPLASWSAGERTDPIVLPGFPPMQNELVLPKGLTYFDELGEALAANPPPRRDACAQRAFRRVGVGPGLAPSTQASGAVRTALAAAAKAAPRLVTRAVEHVNAYSRDRNNGWLVPLDYIGDYGRNYLGRAVIAKFALGANTAPETVYPAAVTDGRGRALRGRHRYRVRFPRGKLPPAGAFWSLTLYTDDGYLYPNAARRYAIGDRTPGLRRGRDGSLTISIQHARPGGAAAANWLPAPRGLFRMIMRVYEPRRSILSGRWKPPAIVRLDRR